MMVYLFLVSGYFRLIASDSMVEFELDSKDVQIYFLWKKEDEDGWKQSLEVNPLRSTRFFHAISSPCPFVEFLILT